MSGCVLRVAGVDFQVDDFLRASILRPCNIYRKGEPRGQTGKLNDKTGMTIIVSEADGDDLPDKFKMP